MAVNNGRIEGTAASGGIVVYIYYDNDLARWPVADPAQPLINGPRGFCLDVTNTSGTTQQVRVSNGTTPITANVGQGDPVTTGNARSRTAAQMAALGYTTRGDVSDFQVG